MLLLVASGGGTLAQAQVGNRQATESASRSARTPALERQFRRAEMAWRRGEGLLEAKARLDHVLRARPSDVEARKLRTEVLLEMERPEEALEDARRAVELSPRDGMAHLLHVEAARESGQVDEAREGLDRAAEYLPERAQPHVRLSWDAMMLDRLAQAEAFGRVGLALDSTAAPAYLQLARVFLRRNRPDEAASVLARGLRGRIVSPRSVREDELLRQVSGHKQLTKWMQ